MIKFTCNIAALNPIFNGAEEGSIKKEQIVIFDERNYQIINVTTSLDETGEKTIHVKAQEVVNLFHIPPEVLGKEILNWLSDKEVVRMREVSKPMRNCVDTTPELRIRLIRGVSCAKAKQKALLIDGVSIKTELLFEIGRVQLPHSLVPANTALKEFWALTKFARSAPSLPQRKFNATLNAAKTDSNDLGNAIAAANAIQDPEKAAKAFLEIARAATQIINAINKS